jgi:redox-sensitive bicupin YhaK (pirin superfamily)
MITLRRSADRGHADHGWLDARHSFSFAGYHDPAHMGFRTLRVLNEDRIAPSGGFGTHPHRDMEIVTWVLEGSLEHRDSEGNEGIIRPGLAQRMSAGTGIVHSEMNNSADEPVHFVQMWVVPDTLGLPPGYEQQDVSPELDSGALVPVAAGDGTAAISINQRGARLWAARPRAGSGVEVPSAPFTHVFVASGSVELAGERLGGGDAARLRDSTELELAAAVDSEVLIWTSDSEAQR